MSARLTRTLAALALAGALVALALTPAAGAVAPGPAAARPAGRTLAADASATPVVFAIIGDFGMHNSHETAVARLVTSWHPAFIVTTGDDYYKPAGGTGSARYYRSAGYAYGRWMAGVPKHGGRVVGLASTNAFFPALGNEDYTNAKPAPKTYTSYFTLPGKGFTSSSGNERYYDFAEGRVHFFILNSTGIEPDGVSATSKQALWLKAALASSESSWNVVIDHNPPYMSTTAHPPTAYMRWPYAEWGASVLVSGHSHVYERLIENGFPYVIDGLGGAARYTFKNVAAGSVVRYQADWGAQRVTETSSTLTFEFFNVKGQLIDSYAVPAREASSTTSG